MTDQQKKAGIPNLDWNEASYSSDSDGTKQEQLKFPKPINNNRDARQVSGNIKSHSVDRGENNQAEAKFDLQPQKIINQQNQNQGPKMQLQSNKQSQQKLALDEEQSNEQDNSVISEIFKQCCAQNQDDQVNSVYNNRDQQIQDMQFNQNRFNCYNSHSSFSTNCEIPHIIQEQPNSY